MVLKGECFCILVIALISIVFSQPCIDGLNCKFLCKNKDVLTGQRQLVDIFNAAYVRIVNDGTYRQILENLNVDQIFVGINDCSPVPSAVPFPDVKSLKCRAKKIIETQNITFGLNNFEFEVNRTGEDITATIDQPLFDVRDAIIAKINENYGINLNVNIFVFGPFEDRTALLNDGIIDLLDPIQSTGNIDTNGLLLRTNRLFSCTIFGAEQFYFVPIDSELNTYNDLIERGSDLTICSSIIFSTVTESYLPLAQLTQLPPPPVTQGDIATCIPAVANGVFDAYGSLFPTPQSTQYDFAGNGLNPNDFKVIRARIANGNPYWVANINKRNF